MTIEGNTLSLDQVTAVVEGKRVLGSAREVQEVRGAMAACERLGEWDPSDPDHLLEAHAVLTPALLAAVFRSRLRNGR